MLTTNENIRFFPEYTAFPLHHLFASPLDNLRCKQQFYNFLHAKSSWNPFKSNLCGPFAIRKSRWADERRLGQDAGSSQFSIKLTLGLSCIVSEFESHCWPKLDDDVACSAGCTGDTGELCRSRSFILICFVKMNSLIFNFKKWLSPSSCLATAAFLNFGVDWAKSSQRCRSAHLKLLYLFQVLTCVWQGSLQWWS